MNLATNLFIIYITFLAFTYTRIFFSKNFRDGHIKKRLRLKELRNTTIKSQQEQKEFIDLKYPKKDKFVWNFKNVIKVLIKTAFVLLTFFIIRFLWKENIYFLFSLWQVLIIMILLPIILNYFLKKYNLHQDDITVYFGGGRK